MAANSNDLAKAIFAYLNGIEFPRTYSPKEFELLIGVDSILDCKLMAQEVEQILGATAPPVG